MLGLDLPEIVIIVVVALIVFGPDKLPQIARELGKFMGQMRRNVESVRREFYNEIYPPAQELRREFLETSRELRAVGQQLRNTTLEDPPSSAATKLPAKAPTEGNSDSSASAATPATQSGTLASPAQGSGTPEAHQPAADEGKGS